MAILTCPHCLAKLKAPDALAAGRRITCPKCQGVFRSVEPTANKGKPSDSIPDAVLLDDEEDDIPDDRPRAKRRRDEDEDDRPRAKRRSRDEDDEEDDRPRRRSDVDDSPKRRKASPALLAGGLVGVVLVLVGGVVLLMFLTRGGTPGGTDMLAHMPSDTVVVSGYDVDALRSHDRFQQALDLQPPFELSEIDRAGIRLADLTQVLVARTGTNGQACALRFKTPPAANRYLSENVKGKNYAKFQSVAGNYQFGYFAGKDVLVLADREATIQAMLDQNAKGKLNSNVQGLVARTRGPVWRAAGSATTNNILPPFELGVQLRMGTNQGTASWFTLDGELANVQIEIDYADDLQAAQGAAVLRGAYQLLQAENDFGRAFGKMPALANEMMDNRRGYAEAIVEVSGRRVTTKIKLPPGEAMRVIAAIRL